MKLTRSSAAANCRGQLFNAVIDGYVTWREESLAVGAAYHNWWRAAMTSAGSPLPRTSRRSTAGSTRLLPTGASSTRLPASEPEMHRGYEPA
jgi:hypothetical protein